MRYIILSTIFLSFLFADLGNQISKTKSNQNTIRNSNQVSRQNSDTLSKSSGKGKENSNSKTISKTFSKISSTNHTVSKNANGSWSISLNPIPYILNDLREHGWNRKSFFLTQKDIGSVDYVIDNDEEYGELQNVGKMQAIQSRASTRDRLLGRREILNLQRYINLLYYTANVIQKATRNLQDFPSLDIEVFENRVKEAVTRAYRQTPRNSIHIRNCNFAGDINSYSCNYGKYTLVLTNALPNLYVNGVPYYSTSTAGYTKPMLNISYATSTNDAFSKLTQNQNSRTVSGMIRNYTNMLMQQGHSKIATKIRNKFVEKTLSKGTNTNVTATVQAINSGSPLAVLKLFQ